MAENAPMPLEGSGRQYGLKQFFKLWDDERGEIVNLDDDPGDEWEDVPEEEDEPVQEEDEQAEQGQAEQEPVNEGPATE